MIRHIYLPGVPSFSFSFPSLESDKKISHIVGDFTPLGFRNIIGQYPKNYSNSGLLYYIIYMICIKTEADSPISSVARIYQSYWCSSLFLRMHVHTTDISFPLYQIETIGICVRWLMVSYLNIFFNEFTNN